jgi:hypothetical protein
MSSENNSEIVEHDWQSLRLPGREGEVYEAWVEAPIDMLPWPPEQAHQVVRGVLSLFGNEIVPVVGVSETGLILGVSKQRVFQLRQKNLLPEPFQILIATPLWHTSDIIHSALTRERRPGNRSRMQNPEQIYKLRTVQLGRLVGKSRDSW